MPKWINTEDEEKYKKIVEEGGGIFLAIFRHFEDEEPLVYFHGPTSSTYAVPMSQLSVESVQQRIQGVK